MNTTESFHGWSCCYSSSSYVRFLSISLTYMVAILTFNLVLYNRGTAQCLLQCPLQTMICQSTAQQKKKAKNRLICLPPALPEVPQIANPMISPRDLSTTDALFCLPHPSPWTKQSGQMHFSTDSTSDRVTNEGLSFHHPWQAPGRDTGWAGGSMYPRLKL